ncbi:pyridoxal-phosphate dependent enzyme [Streptomyces sp. NPDC001941]|uniref:pyridoxal-phosphate dependent enzyme n=1 Tax=Streptomyces sp. NPDC001941 TaxID=3154659 RepID=UPI00332A3BEF
MPDTRSAPAPTGAPSAPGPADVARARRRLAGRVQRTPLVRSDQLDALCGARLWLKAENLQRGGSFKVRGALLAVEELAAAGSRGVLAQSTGNHAIAVALAARAHRLPTLIVLPSDAPPAKVGRIREAGARVVFAGTTLAERVARVAELRVRHGYDVVDPYENPYVVAGQGTASAELLEQAADEGVALDSLVVPIGGGSALAGACLAAAGHGTAVLGAEPAAVPAFTAALRAGGPVTVPARHTLADGLRPDRIGDLPYSLASPVARVLTVSEEDIADALRTALLTARLLVEPAAATALAGALAHAAGAGRGTDIGVLLSGGNVEPALVATLLAGAVEAPRVAVAS